VPIILTVMFETQWWRETKATKASVYPCVCLSVCVAACLPVSPPARVEQCVWMCVRACVVKNQYDTTVEQWTTNEAYSSTHSSTHHVTCHLCSITSLAAKLLGLLTLPISKLSFTDKDKVSTKLLQHRKRCIGKFRRQKLAISTRTDWMDRQIAVIDV